MSVIIRSRPKFFHMVSTLPMRVSCGVAPDALKAWLFCQAIVP